MADSRDIYDRRPTSKSRGKTQDRIMARQHAPGELPGTGDALAAPPEGSIGAAIVDFNARWVGEQAITVRRTYERSLVLLVRDLEAEGPPCAEPLARLTAERLEQHLQWRVDQRLNFQQELLRAGVHLARFASWCDEHAGTDIGATRERMRDAAERVADEHAFTYGIEQDPPLDA